MNGDDLGRAYADMLKGLFIVGIVIFVVSLAVAVFVGRCSKSVHIRIWQDDATTTPEKEPHNG